MSIGSTIDETYQRTRLYIQHPKLLAAKSLEAVVGFGTPIAAVMTVGADPKGMIVEKVVTGPYKAVTGLYELLSMYIQDTGVREATGKAAGEVFEFIGHAAQNIASHPIQTILIAGAAYVCGKLTQQGIKNLENQKKQNIVEYNVKRHNMEMIKMIREKTTQDFEKKKTELTRLVEEVEGLKIYAPPRISIIIELSKDVEITDYLRAFPTISDSMKKELGEYIVQIKDYATGKIE